MGVVDSIQGLKYLGEEWFQYEPGNCTRYVFKLEPVSRGLSKTFGMGEWGGYLLLWGPDTNPSWANMAIPAESFIALSYFMEKTCLGAADATPMLYAVSQLTGCGTNMESPDFRR